MIASIDMNWWDLFAMPVGLVICFGPALAVWLREEVRGDSPEKTSRKP